MEKKPPLIANREGLLIAVGECLNAWSAVELEIGNLYMILHGVGRDEFSHPIRIAYEAVVSLEVRVDMIDAFVEADKEISDGYYPHVNLLSKRIKKLYKKRHEIAHFSIVGRPSGNSFQYLIRPFFTWSKFISNEGAELNTKQINERAANFRELSERIGRHIQHVGALRELPLTHYVQAGDIVFPPLGPADLNQEVPLPPPPPSEK